MKIPHDEIEELLRETIALHVMPRYQRLARHEIDEKKANDFVTVADIEAERHLAPRLAALIAGSRVLGEEAASRNPVLLQLLESDDLLWLVDPVDGTRSFMAAQSGIIADLCSSDICAKRPGANASASANPPITCFIIDLQIEKLRRRAGCRVQDTYRQGLGRIGPAPSPHRGPAPTAIGGWLRRLAAGKRFLQSARPGACRAVAHPQLNMIALLRLAAAADGPRPGREVRLGAAIGSAALPGRGSGPNPPRS